MKHFIHLFVTGNVSKLLSRDKNYEYIHSDVRIARRTIIINNNPVALQPYRALADRAAAAGQRS